MYVDDMCIFVFSNDGSRRGYQNATVPGLTDRHMLDAIERADEAGFWVEPCGDTCVDCGYRKPMERKNEVTVDVPVPVHVADNATLSVTTEEDES